jgi:hypothetical protein
VIEDVFGACLYHNFMRMYAREDSKTKFLRGTKKIFWSLCVCRNMRIELSKNTSTTKASFLIN